MKATESAHRGCTVTVIPDKKIVLLRLIATNTPFDDVSSWQRRCQFFKLYFDSEASLRPMLSFAGSHSHLVVAKPPSIPYVISYRLYNPPSFSVFPSFLYISYSLFLLGFSLLVFIFKSSAQFFHVMDNAYPLYVSLAGYLPPSSLFCLSLSLVCQYI